MLAMAPPVTSRSAAAISLLTRQKPVSSAAMIVPEKARVNNETLTITVLFNNFSLKEGISDCDIIFPAKNLIVRLQSLASVWQRWFESSGNGGNPNFLLQQHISTG